MTSRRVRRRDGVLMFAAAAESLVIRSDDDVSVFDERIDARQAVVGPRVAADQEVLIERLCGVGCLRRAAVLGRSGGAVRPCDDRTSARGRRTRRCHNERGCKRLAFLRVGRDVGDAPRPRAGDRRVDLFGLDDLSQLAVGRHPGHGVVERRQRHLSARNSRRSERQRDDDGKGEGERLLVHICALHTGANQTFYHGLVTWVRVTSGWWNHRARRVVLI